MAAVRHLVPLHHTASASIPWGAGRPPGPDPLALATAIRAARRRDLVTIGRNVNQVAAALNAALARGLTPQGQLERTASLLARARAWRRDEHSD